MEIDPSFVSLTQRGVYKLEEDKETSFESSPEIWEGLEALTSSDLNTRRAGLELLVQMDLVHRSPLVAYVLATRLDEPDLALRTRIVQVLGSVLDDLNNGRSADVPVRLQLGSYLAQMRTRRIFALLQVAEADPSTHEALTRLLNHCPFGGTQLANMLADRYLSLSIRKYAADFIARVGYLDVLPDLERLFTRLEKRLNGHDMNGLTEQDGEIYLLPAIQEAIQILKAP